MAKKLAIEWDSQALRMVVARQRGSSITVDQAIVVPLSAAGEGLDSVEARAGRLLTEQVASFGLNKLPAILGINRASIELQVFSVPPVPEAELPDIVRFQAIRECANVGDDGVVDFVRLPMTKDGQSRVLAAAISAKQLKACHKLCNQAQIQPQSFYIRPFGAARLAASQSNLAGQTFLLVETLVDRVELTVVHQNEVVLTRSTRVPGETNTDEFLKTLQGEIRRTIFAARTKDDSVAIAQIVILGQPAGQAQWQEFGRDVKCAVEFLNPLAAEHVTTSVEVLPETACQLGALVGLLLADSTGTHPSIDFLNPRKKPEAPDRRRTYVLAALAAACVVLVAGYAIWSSIGAKDARIAELKAEIAKVQKSNEPLLKVEEQIIEIDQWVAADVQWLDELYRLSDKMPSADETIIKQLHMGTRTDAGGTISFNGYVSDHSVIAKLEGSLRDDYHHVQGKESKYEEYGDGAYHWSFLESITVVDDEADRFTNTPVAAAEEETESSQSTDDQSTDKEPAPAEPEASEPKVSGAGETEAVSTEEPQQPEEIAPMPASETAEVITNKPQDQS
ncbi:hypothetical protein DTL42_04090 [Bremerella cremea]|uniref:Competence protein A n=1 Tax=Bremerella cremea TaxID=1031537 RepID=A0A368KV78_9BACT|nr:hypothetical protein [Bremerella cremea]RCS54333.1 hypothetical protein DTL42_04090 [Bremerella cremea]